MSIGDLMSNLNVADKYENANQVRQSTARGLLPQGLGEQLAMMKQQEEVSAKASAEPPPQGTVASDILAQADAIVNSPEQIMRKMALLDTDIERLKDEIESGKMNSVTGYIALTDMIKEFNTLKSKLPTVPAGLETLQAQAPAEGIPALPSNLPEQGMEAGGIVVLADGGEVDDEDLRKFVHPDSVERTEKRERKSRHMFLPTYAQDRMIAGEYTGMYPVGETGTLITRAGGTAGLDGLRGRIGSAGVGYSQKMGPGYLSGMINRAIGQNGTSANLNYTIPFKEGGDVKHYAVGDKVKGSPLMHEDYKAALERKVMEDMERLGRAEPFQKSEALMEQYKAEREKGREEALNMALIRAGAQMMGGTSPYAMANIGPGVGAGIETLAKSRAQEAEDRKLMLQQQVEAEKARFAKDVQLAGLRQTSLGQLYGKEIGLAQALATKAQAGATSALANEQRNTRLMLEAQNLFNNAATRKAAQLFAADKAKYNFDTDSKQLQEDARTQAWKELEPKVQALLPGLKAQYEAAETPKGGAGTPPPATTPTKSLGGDTGWKALPKNDQGYPIVKSQTEYNLLPSGQTYLGPDNLLHTKR